MRNLWFSKDNIDLPSYPKGAQKYSEKKAHEEDKVKKKEEVSENKN